MGNSSGTLLNYNPEDEIDTPENKLNLLPFMYPNNGLYHNYDTLVKNYPRVIFFNIEEQAKYSDAITRRYALNQHFIIKMSTQLNISASDYSKTANTTSIGNIAFIAIHQGPESKWGMYYAEVMNCLKKIHNS